MSRIPNIGKRKDLEPWLCNILVNYLGEVASDLPGLVLRETAHVLLLGEDRGCRLGCRASSRSRTLIHKFFSVTIHTYGTVHSYNGSFITFAEALLHIWNLPGVAKPRLKTRACLTASQSTTIWATPHPIFGVSTNIGSRSILQEAQIRISMLCFQESFVSIW